MQTKPIAPWILLMSILALLSLNACTGDGADGIQSDTEYNATKPLVPTPPLLQAFTGVVSKQASASEVIGSIVTNNIEASGAIAIILNGIGYQNFLVDLEGVITVASGALIAYENIPVYTLIATMIDANAQSISHGTVIISVVETPDTNSSTVTESSREVPILDETIANIAENAPEGTIVGYMIMVNPQESVIQWTLIGEDKEHFNIASDATITVAKDALMRGGKIYQFLVKATNTMGDSEFRTLNITVR
ncbi:MAG: hypothetical protein Q9M36_03595 [Sulfurovum sp.]|nr:hypothetical protein [Sulfurovum sp.]